VRRPARRRRARPRQLELGARHHPRAQGRDAAADPRSGGRRLLAPRAERRLAAGRRVERRRRRAACTLPRPRPRRAQPAGGRARARRRAGLSTGLARFPFAAPEAEGFVLGRPADEVDHYAALLQGVAYVERLCFDYLDLLGAPTDGELSLTGGATRSRYWCQLRADVLGRPVRLPGSAEAALGMAILAAAAGRRVSDVASQMVRVREVIEPRPDRVERFRAPYARLIDELQRRGWLEPRVADHARRRATQ
jgi:hypothetical protein